MNDLLPTMSLRFVEREEQSQLAADGSLLPGNYVRVVTKRVLQQHWTDTYGRGEWRDVPLAIEDEMLRIAGKPSMEEVK